MSGGYAHRATVPARLSPKAITLNLGTHALATMYLSAFQGHPNACNSLQSQRSRMPHTTLGRRHDTVVESGRWRAFRASCWTTGHASTSRLWLMTSCTKRCKKGISKGISDPEKATRGYAAVRHNPFLNFALHEVGVTGFEPATSTSRT